MRIIFKALTLCVLVCLGVYACKSSDSSIKASNEFNGDKLGYWYEIFSFNEGDPYNFVDYHQRNKALLLGNGAGDLVPETLKGLWFMDGNPLTDKTIQFGKVFKSQAGHDIMLKVGDPMNFSWTNIPKSHTLNKLIDKFSYEYEISFLDCPADVKKERETMWGMKNGSCSKADKQFATITPYIKIAGRRTGISDKLAYFDMYLRPKEGDYLVWERRSKVFQVVDDITAPFKKDTDEKGWHRYKFTQILDKDGSILQSYQRFTEHLKSFAAENGVPYQSLLFYKCLEGKTGCDQQHLEELNAQSESKFSGDDGAKRFGSFPFF